MKVRPLTVVQWAVLAIALLFVAGETRSWVRERCSSPAAGAFLRRACDALDVRTELPAGVAVQLEDADDVADADVQAIPTSPNGAGECATGAGLDELIYQAKDLAELERSVRRDFDGNGVVGTVGGRRQALASAPKSAKGGSAVAGGVERGAAGLVDLPAGFMDLPAPDAPAEAGGRAIFARKQFGAAPNGGTVTVSADRQGGPVAVDVVAEPAPRAEWLHVLRGSLILPAPIAGQDDADARLEADWLFGRYRALKVGLQVYGERDDAGVALLLEIECAKGLGGCDPSRP